jgi:unsaturated chondroitin disaccharide hydrolase
MQRLALLAWVSVTCLASEARAQQLDSLQGIASDLTFIEQQVTKTLNSLAPPTSTSALYPVSGGDSGTWTTTTPSDNALGWTSGFFPGELWLLSQATTGQQQQQWLTAAEQWTAPLASQASNVSRVDPTDIGFIIGTSFGNGYRLTGDPSYQSVLVTAGGSLASLYNSKVGAVQSWNFPPNHPFQVIIDSMMTLGPLQWGATAIGGNPAWAGMAANHTETVTSTLVRGDGSTGEVATFNTTSGSLVGVTTFAGYSNTSTWARGEAWALYGFVQAYQTSDNPAFLTTAEDVANYFVGELVADDTWIPPWDFDAPGTQPVDTSAAAIAADGLVMLSTVAGGTLGAMYLTDAEDILGALSSSYLDTSPSGEAVLTDGYTGTVNGTNTALIYGDYYFTEALLRLQNVLDGEPDWVLYSPAATSVVPEPATWTMMVLGFAGLGFAGYRRRPRSSRA